jgi:hypothetical protein
MRVWDVDPRKLCRQNPLGEHQDYAGYRNHSESKRWIGNLTALSYGHDRLVDEVTRLGYGYFSSSPELEGIMQQDEFLLSVFEQEELHRARDCDCLLLDD